jgi:FdhD protein
MVMAHGLNMKRHRSLESETDSLGERRAGLPWQIQRIHKDKTEELTDHVVLEEPLEIVVNGKTLAILMRLPGQEKELAAGFCVTEGYIRRAEDILLIHHCGQGLPAPGEEETDGTLGSRNRAELQVMEEGLIPRDRAEATRLIRSGCGAADIGPIRETLPFLSPGVLADASLLLELARRVRDLQVVHDRTGGVHAAAVFGLKGEVIGLAEDIGRHNAVDKVLGHCLLRRIPIKDKILITSGRASYEMAVKAIRVGIPVIATMSSPTSLAVELAEDRGLTLIGYLRGGRMNVYTHGERIRKA